ncbi:MAG: hypothetical protein OK422_01600 [Thaumarchaeota archaeon]|nr:hypothetical protein [Nitrososphaerota archaeon]
MRLSVVVLAAILLFQLPPVAAQAPAQVQQIKHIIVIVEENHTFDNYFGTYPGARGLNLSTSLPEGGTTGKSVKPFHIEGTTITHDLCHSWECAHMAYNNGSMDRFVAVSKSNLTMGYFDYHQIPYYWSYASKFVLFDNFFSSVMAPSVPNHLFLIAGQSGNARAGIAGLTFSFKTIFDELDRQHVSWRYYAGGYEIANGWNPLPAFSSFAGNQSRLSHLASTEQFAVDVKSHKLADVVYVMPSTDAISEHPPYDVVSGERAVVSMINRVMMSEYWSSSAIFVTWDDYGGWYDHVAPPQVDSVGYGFRVPCLIISPYAKHGVIDHTQADFTSILKFIETIHHLPALTQRDAAANDLTEGFDFTASPAPPLLLPGLYISDKYPLALRPNVTLGLGSVLGVALPALTTTKVWMTPPNPRVGDPVKVNFVIANRGPASAQGFEVGLYANDTTGNYVRVDFVGNLSLRSGQSYGGSFSKSLIAKAGAQNVTVVANDLGTISESNDLNNALTRTFIASAAPVVPTGLSSLSFVFYGLIIAGTVAFLVSLDFLLRRSSRSRTAGARDSVSLRASTALKRPQRID